jgi:alpha,alpha-trehalase
MADDDAYYQNVIAWLLAHPAVHTDYLVDGPENPRPGDRGASGGDQLRSLPPRRSAPARMQVRHWLSRDFYKGDRAMRESGFDPSFRFGVFDGSTHHFAPVCLNALLYKYELDLAWMADRAGQARRREEVGCQAAQARRGGDGPLSYGMRRRA